MLLYQSCLSKSAKVPTSTVLLLVTLWNHKFIILVFTILNSSQCGFYKALQGCAWCVSSLSRHTLASKIMWGFKHKRNTVFMWNNNIVSRVLWLQVHYHVSIRGNFNFITSKTDNQLTNRKWSQLLHENIQGQFPTEFLRLGCFQPWHRRDHINTATRINDWSWLDNQ